MTSACERWVEHEAWESPRRGPAPHAHPATRPVRVGVALDGERHVAGTLATSLAASLAARGHSVELLDVDALTRDRHLAAEWLAELDALVTGGRRPALVAVVRKAERSGVPVVDLDALPEGSDGAGACDRLADLVVARAFEAAAALTEP